MSYEFDPNDERQVSKSKAKDKRAREIEIEELREILATVAGRRFVWRYLSKCQVFGQTATQSGSWTYFNEGARSIGLQLFSELNEANPEAFVKMMNESKGEQSNVN